MKCFDMCLYLNWWCRTKCYSFPRIPKWQYFKIVQLPLRRVISVVCNKDAWRNRRWVRDLTLCIRKRTQYVRAPATLYWSTERTAQSISRGMVKAPAYGPWGKLAKWMWNLGQNLFHIRLTLPVHSSQWQGRLLQMQATFKPQECILQTSLKTLEVWTNWNAFWRRKSKDDIGETLWRISLNILQDGHISNVSEELVDPSDDTSTKKLNVF